MRQQSPGRLSDWFVSNADRKPLSGSAEPGAVTKLEAILYATYLYLSVLYISWKWDRDWERQLDANFWMKTLASVSRNSICAIQDCWSEAMFLLALLPSWCVLPTTVMCVMLCVAAVFKGGTGRALHQGITLFRSCLGVRFLYSTEWMEKSAIQPYVPVTLASSVHPSRRGTGVSWESFKRPCVYYISSHPCKSRLFFSIVSAVSLCSLPVASLPWLSPSLCFHSFTYFCHTALYCLYVAEVRARGGS